MTPSESRPERVPLAYRVVRGWMRLNARLVPTGERERWRTEWEGELWYGVAGKPGAVRWRAAFGLARGILHDALHLRGFARRTKRRSQQRSRDSLMHAVNDVRYTLRMLRKAPGFTAVVAITLALGIGGTVTIFSVVNALLLQPLPYPDADRLVTLWQGRTGANVDKDWLSAGHFADIRDQTDSFETLALAEGSSYTMTGRGRAARVGWVQAQSALLHMLGARAAVGRIFDTGDDRPGGDTVALLSHDLWLGAFGGDPEAVGQSITLDGRVYEIVGVLAPDVLLDNEVLPTWGAIGRVDVVLSAPLTEEVLSDRVNEGYNVVGRLRPGVTLARVQAELDVVAARIQELHEADPNSGFFIDAVPLIEEVVGSVRRPLIVLLGAVGGVLLIACVNVANLLLARAASRRRELGVRVALGAERGRLIRQLLTESALLAVLGGGLGIGVAGAGLVTVHRLGVASLPRLSEIGIDARVLAFALAVTALTCLVFGWVPAMRMSRVDPGTSMAAGGRGGQEGALWSRFNLASGLVVAEIGLSLVLLVGGVLVTRSFAALQQVDPGFRVDNRLTFWVRLSGDEYRDRRSRVAFYERLMERLGALPGVETVGAVSHLPLSGGVSWAPLQLVDYVPPQGDDHEIVSEFRYATADYFSTLGIPLIRGRFFDERDQLGAASVALIDEHFAETYFPDRDPIGMRVSTWFDGALTIVGVVGTIKYDGLDRDSRVTTYYAQEQWGVRGMFLTIRTAGDPTLLAGPATRIVEEMDAGVAIVDVRPMRSWLADSLAERRFSTLLLQGLAAVGMVLACVGIYGLITYRVNQGANELGLRMALGAPARRIFQLVLGHGLALALAGVATGLVVAFTMTGFLRSMLFGVGAFDAETFAGVAVGLVATTLLACYVPARRATKVDPVGAIR